MVRAKFRCQSVEEIAASPGNDFTVKLRPVTGGSEENKKFFQATPGGEITLFVVNGETAKNFQPGKNVYVDFTPAEDYRRKEVIMLPTLFMVFVMAVFTIAIIGVQIGCTLYLRKDKNVKVINKDKFDAALAQASANAKTNTASLDAIDHLDEEVFDFGPSAEGVAAIDQAYSDSTKNLLDRLTAPATPKDSSAGSAVPSANIGDQTSTPPDPVPAD